MTTDQMFVSSRSVSPRNWEAPDRPATHVERTLINAILDGTFAAGTELPGERQLATELGVTRPTLREVLQRLSRDGWLRIRQGKPTLVNDFWRQGGLNVLSALVQYRSDLPRAFVPNLLEVRMHLAPAYTRSAVQRAPADVIALLSGRRDLADTAEAFAAFDWELHHGLAVASGNPVYTLILNGFAEFYRKMAALYFSDAEARGISADFYVALLQATRQGKADGAAHLTRQVMARSLELWAAARRE